MNFTRREFITSALSALAGLFIRPVIKRQSTLTQDISLAQMAEISEWIEDPEYSKPMEIMKEDSCNAVMLHIPISQLRERPSWIQEYLSERGCPQAYAEVIDNPCQGCNICKVNDDPEFCEAMYFLL